MGPDIVSPDRTPRILLGRIAGAHGIRGEVLIKTFTAEPESIGAYGPLADKSGTRSVRIVSARASQKGVVARIEGVSDRNAAEALKGMELYVSRERLPTAGTDEFYHADLVGLAAVDRDGKTIGRIVAVQNFGAGDLLEIQVEGATKTELVPFTDDAVPEVDVVAGRAVVVIPDETGEA